MIESFYFVKFTVFMSPFALKIVNKMSGDIAHIRPFETIYSNFFILEEGS